MIRHDAQPRRDLARRRGHDLRGQTVVAASALAGGCLAVVALWMTASGAATTGIATR
jgi:hypothetical protein